MLNSNVFVTLSCSRKVFLPFSLASTACLGEDGSCADTSDASEHLLGPEKKCSLAPHARSDMLPLYLPLLTVIMFSMYHFDLEKFQVAVVRPTAGAGEPSLYLEAKQCYSPFASRCFKQSSTGHRGPEQQELNVLTKLPTSLELAQAARHGPRQFLQYLCQCKAPWTQWTQRGG